MLKRSKNFNKDAVSLFICIILAIGLWCYVAFVENPDMSRWITGIPITITGTDALNEKGLSIQSISSDRIDVKVSATRSQFRYLSSDTITATADVSRISKTGSSVINVIVTLPTSSANAVVVDRRKSTVTVEVEEYVQKEFEIEVNVSHYPSDGYYVNSTNCDGVSSVTLSGTKTAIESVSSLKTAPIDLSGAVGNVVYPASLIAYDSNGKEVTSVTADVEKINVTFELYRKREVPVSVTLKNGTNVKATASPSTITIEGPAAAVDAIESISTEPVDASALSDDRTVTVPFTFPSSVSAADSGTSVCSVTLEASE
jgi:YbbR domain-containing protein